MNIANISFQGIPDNYIKIDNFLSRSAQPKREDFQWLKEQGVTDIINFRYRDIDFDEKEAVKKLKLRYHVLPSISEAPNKKNVKAFFKLLKGVKNRDGKAHIHCMAGADRTGMYSFLYKMSKGIGSLEENRAEWIRLGLNIEKYPNLMQWAERLYKTALKK